MALALSQQQREVAQESLAQAEARGARARLVLLGDWFGLDGGLKRGGVAGACPPIRFQRVFRD